MYHVGWALFGIGILFMLGTTILAGYAVVGLVMLVIKIIKKINKANEAKRIAKFQKLQYERNYYLWWQQQASLSR